jgi:hypothetical protein
MTPKELREQYESIVNVATALMNECKRLESRLSEMERELDWVDVKLKQVADIEDIPERSRLVNRQGKLHVIVARAQQYPSLTRQLSDKSQECEMADLRVKQEIGLRESCEKALSDSQADCNKAIDQRNKLAVELFDSQTKEGR